jgi:hypothetical protein
MSLPPQISKFVAVEPPLAMTETSCWTWLGGLDWDGYGMGWDGAIKKTVRAHRLVYEILVGPIPTGKCLLHRCDNPVCVNPDHMFIGTIADNNRDMHAKGRAAVGEKHGMNKLSVEQVRAIRLAPEGYAQIAEKFEVSYGLVAAIKQRLLWKHLDGPVVRPRMGPNPYNRREKNG